MTATQERAPASAKRVVHKPSQKVSIKDLAQLATRSKQVINFIRQQAFNPHDEKEAPSFSTSELREILDQSEDWMNYRLRIGTEPKGTLVRNRLMFTLPQVQEWARKFRSDFLKPAGARCKVIAMGNFKGGSTKTTTAVTTAQGLSMRGHRVLVVDGDPQASASILFGLVSGTDALQSLLPVCEGKLQSAESLVRKTYWPGIDLIPATRTLAAADTALPLISQEKPELLWWEVVSKALEPLREQYDVILIDTAPTLSPLSSSLFMAADALVVPILPNALDFASSSEFWGMFAEFFAQFEQYGIPAKDYDFVKVVLTRVEPYDEDSLQPTAQVIRMIRKAYGDYVLRGEIPRTSRTTGASVHFGTIFDSRKYKSTREERRRALQPYVQYVLSVEKALCEAWATDLKEMA